ncbi:CopG family ribbon-helix-helix protein [Natrinema sp. CGMCC1.2065]|uniref:CopG family ribbon-helix-helix protein n=1 Tax=Natrinema sp. CGMCC1.2065 TaxID=3445767 RepID=UPI003F4A13CB
MANPSFSIPDEKLEEFDKIILAKKSNGDLPMDASRSEVIRELVEEYVEGNRNSSQTTMATAD